MNLEIRRSFVKDVEKLPASTKVMIEKVIQDIISKNKLSELSSCKNYQVLKLLIE